ncbi:phage tail tube protein [Actinoplanes sp. CA-054009]
MAVIQDSYIGLAEEVAYGTAIAPARFLEMASEGLAGTYERIESEGFRAGQKVLRSDRFVPNPKGAEGDLSVEALDAGHGLLLKHALGAVSSGTPTGGFTVHTFTLGGLLGKSLSFQVGRVDASGVAQVFTYEGGKVNSLEIENSVDGVLNLNFSLDFEKETIGAGTGAYAAATPTYAANSQLFTFQGLVVNVGGTVFSSSDVKFTIDNALKTDRYYTSNGGMKKEPVTEGLREVSWEFAGEFDGIAHANRVAAALATGTLATIDATWTTPQGGELKVSLPFARFDEGPANFDGAQLIEQNVSGKALEDGSSSAITITYKTKDAAP